ncbi:hypothetical protein [Celeribacter sp. PS-C1]|uniref:hypothetical protein n=1 Tax=Celeribacter sp. PS-C1 TaxID=2820813 RepID=UPI001CA544AA|nr:hypothetical protein [Celeribacter sp. PS-C1]MBW6419321.1 hypothetical protein [Celeribacter sp. PS-C1]
MNDATETEKPRVTLHIGVHFATTQDLQRSVSANHAQLKKHGVHVPAPRHAWRVISKMLETLDGLPPIAAEEAQVRSALLGTSEAQHLFLADARWAAPLRESVDGEILYPGIGDRVAAVAELFSEAELQISLALINPAIFLHNSFASGTAPRLLSTFVDQVAPESLRWRDTVAALRAAVPDVPLLIWAEEDAPLIWPTVMRHLFHLPPEVPVAGRILPLKPLLSQEGFEQLKSSLTSHPPETPVQYEHVIMAFMEKYGREEALSPHCDIPGWDAEDIDILTAHYEEDLEALAQEEGITLLQPVS